MSAILRRLTSRYTFKNASGDTSLVEGRLRFRRNSVPLTRIYSRVEAGDLRPTFRILYENVLLT